MKNFVVATPYRSVCDDQARVLHAEGMLRLYATWTRRGSPGIPTRITRKLPILGLLAYAGARCLPSYHAETFRFSLYPAYDAWVSSMLQPGDSVISSYCYANSSFRKAQRLGGETFLDGGNSHPDNFWEILIEEHSRWNCPYPPVPHFYIKRAREIVQHADYVLSPSSFVTNSFLERGFTAQQIIPVVYPQDLNLFKPRAHPRENERPFTIVSTGSLSLRKGTPYLLEAFRLVRQAIPNTRLLLTDSKASSIIPILEKYRDLPIEWAPPLPHDRLAARLQSADLFILPSLEDGWARTVSEAMACGLPVIVTKHTGACDAVVENINGSIVPIRDSVLIAEKAISWWNKLKEGHSINASHIVSKLSMESLIKSLKPLMDP